MNFGQARVRLVQVGLALAAATLVAGCGNNYRPVVTPSNPSGPSAQPESLVVVISAPSTTSDGYATIIDYSGDSVMAAQAIGVDPLAFTMDANGAYGYTINGVGTVTNFPVSTTLQEEQIVYSSLPSGADLVNLFSPSSGLWAANLTGNEVNVSTATGIPENFSNFVTVTTPPVTVAGAGSSSVYDFAISQNNSDSSGMDCNISPTTQQDGTVTGISEISTTSLSLGNTIQVGKCPVYGVESSDGQRLFVLNRGSDTISVINVQKDGLDSCTCPSTGCVNNSGQTYFCHPTLPLSTTALLNTSIYPPNCDYASDPTCGGMPAAAGPVYAEYNAATSQLVVADYGGSAISIIDVSLDEYGNDSSTFGTTYTVAVGKNPAGVTVLNDGRRAYTANQSDQSVTVVNLSSHTVETTLTVTGHPRTVESVENSEYGKVYVASPDSPDLTIIDTGGADPDTVGTTLDLASGNIVDVRVSAQNGESGNSDIVSRMPGYGEPCNLPLSEFNPASPGSHSPSLANCQAQDSSLLH